MAQKAPAKKAATKKAAPVKKTAATKNVAKGDSYSCGVCGIVVTVDEACGREEVCDIIYFGESMKPKEAKSRAAKK